MTIQVLLSGRLRLDGYGHGQPMNSDGTFPLDLSQEGTVQDVAQALGIPGGKVAMTMRNGRKCDGRAQVQSGDRVVLIPPDVACLWRFLGTVNLGAESVFDF